MKTFVIHLRCGLVLHRRAISFPVAWRYAVRTWGENLHAVLEQREAKVIAA